MVSIQRKWDYLTKDQRYSACEAIISHFRSEWNEEIGMIAAWDFLDAVLEEVGKAIYKKGIEDARMTMREWFENLEVNLEVLTER